MRHVALTVILVAGLFDVAAADDRLERGKKLVKSWQCVDCHGLTGNNRSVAPNYVPMLAGQPAGYTAYALKEFRSGDRKQSGTWSGMNMRARALSDQDIEDIAAYYEAQKRY